MELNDAVAVATATSGGIGRAVSEALLKAGADVFIPGWGRGRYILPHRDLFQRNGNLRLVCTG